MIFSGNHHIGSELSLASAVFITGLVYVLAVLSNFFKWARVNYPIGDANTRPTDKENHFQN